MDINKLWNNFEISGKVDDYLKYKMNNVIEDEGLNEIIQTKRDSDKGNTIQGE